MYNLPGDMMKRFFKNGTAVIFTLGMIFCVLIVCAVFYFSNTRYENTEYSKEEVSKMQAEKININTAKVSDFYALGEIGEDVADKIVDYREENGEFESIEEILEIDGISKATFERIKVFLTVKQEDDLFAQ